MIHHRAVKGRIVGLFSGHWSRRCRSSTGWGRRSATPASTTCSTRTFSGARRCAYAGRMQRAAGRHPVQRSPGCRIGWLVVAPGDRGNGVGQALVTEAMRRPNGPGGTQRGPEVLRTARLFHFCPFSAPAAWSYRLHVSEAIRNGRTAVPGGENPFGRLADVVFEVAVCQDTRLIDAPAARTLGCNLRLYRSRIIR